MNGVNFSAAIMCVVVSSLAAQPMGTWSSCSWGVTISSINGVVVWDRDGDGPEPALPYLATDNGIFVKQPGSGELFPIESFEGCRVTSITTWDPDGDGPMRPMLAFVLQDSAFEPADVHTIRLDLDGVERGELLGTFDSDVRSMTTYDTNMDGMRDLVVAGAFDNLLGGTPMPLSKTAVFNGTAWSQLGTAPDSTVEVAKVIECTPGNSAIPCDGDSTLVIGGFFSQAGALSADGIACWDDTSADWVACTQGTGLSGTTVVRDVAGWESDEGPQLVVAGFDIWVDGVPVGNVAHFDGTQWQGLGPGPFGNTEALTTFDVDGDGTPEPVIAAVFNEGGGSFPFQVAYWDGSSWLELDGGELSSPSFVNAKELLVLDAEGANPALMVVGQFDSVDGIVAENLAIWTPDGDGGPCNDADLAEPFGELNFFDVSAFLGLYAVQDPRADLNGDGMINFFDVSTLLTLYSNGCG